MRRRYRHRGRKGFGGRAAWLARARRVLSVTLVLGLSLLVARGIGRIDLDAAFPVESIEIEGALLHVDATALARRLSAGLRDGFFSLDLDAVRRLVRRDPWVKTVSVRRRWPAGIIVSVEERQAVAYWNDHAYISAEGEVFAPARVVENRMLPDMRGPQGQHRTVWTFLNEVYRPLQAIGFRVLSVELDQRRAWSLRLVRPSSLQQPMTAGDEQDGWRRNSLLVKLGRDKTAARLQRFIRVFASAGNLPVDDLAMMDMRYPNGFALLKRPVVATPKPLAEGRRNHPQKTLRTQKKV